MTIQINKDFLTEYKDDVWKGFNARELISIITGGATAFGVVILLYYFTKMNPATLVYFAVPFAIPAVGIGFYRFQGYLSLTDLLKEMMYTWYTKELHSESEEDVPGTTIFTMEIDPEIARKGGKK
ncbi:MAG: PrgI family protein [Lachnospiraceae bacterium]|nr:PrgI family protein [Lachnospiraceae bacterium]